jgi:outer membrane biosynthesis protein TonB
MKTMLILSILTLLSAFARADQSVATYAPPSALEIESTYFHPAAAHYIQGETAAASNLVAQGLNIDPDDQKLLELKKLIEQQQEQEQQQNKDQQQQRDKNEQEEENQEQQPQDQEQEGDQQDQNREDPKQEENKGDEQNQQNEQQEQPQPAPQKEMSEMTPEEANQLLDAMKQEERNKRLRLKRVYGNPVNVEKDW